MTLGYLYFLTQRKEWLNGLKFFVLTFLSLSTIHHYMGVLYSQTRSLPEWYFLHLKQGSPRKGEYTLLNSSWYEGRLIKQIVGIPGDTISYDEQGNLLINDRCLGKPLSQSQEGEPLTPIQAQTIPEGYVFVYAPHERSFDSRYQELGLVPQAALYGKVIPLV